MAAGVEVEDQLDVVQLEGPAAEAGGPPPLRQPVQRLHVPLHLPPIAVRI